MASDRVYRPDYLEGAGLVDDHLFGGDYGRGYATLRSGGNGRCRPLEKDVACHPAGDSPGHHYASDSQNRQYPGFGLRAYVLAAQFLEPRSGRDFRYIYLYGGAKERAVELQYHRRPV
ncbi:hypothetical protein D1872_283610 [compost metagenome]